jgi:hypothetical protein
MPTGDRGQPHSGILVSEDDDDTSSTPHAGLGERKTTGALLALAFVLVGVVVLLAEPPRTLIGQPSNAPSPTPSRNDSGTPLPTEAEAWGTIWTRANGVQVLRPTWLPRSEDEYQITFDTSSDGFFAYSMSYVELRPAFGKIVWNVAFSADSVDGPSRALQQFGDAAHDAQVRGHAAELFGNGSPGWTLAWKEGNYRYAVQAFAVSYEDLLHITESLAPVVDATGRITPPR